MKIITIGAGFLASHLPYIQHHGRISSDVGSINRFIDEYKPDVIVNAIGKTGRPNIDWCEFNKVETYTSNVVIPLMLASECEKRDIRLITYGSGCIYTGPSPYVQTYCEYDSYDCYDPGWTEEDTPNPRSYYSITKYCADLAIGSMKNVCILRLRMPISGSISKRNLISKLIGYKKVLIENNSVSFCSDIVNATQFAIDKKLSGIFHITSPKPIYHSDILSKYQMYVPDHTYEKITKQELDTITTAGRSNCILNSNKIRELGFQFLDQDEQLHECVKQYIANSKE